MCFYHDLANSVYSVGELEFTRVGFEAETCLVIADLLAFR